MSITQVFSQASALRSEGKVESAIELLEDALRSHSDDIRLWELLGVIHHGQHDYTNAAAALETATLLKPLSIGAQLTLGSCYIELQHRLAAGAIYSHLVKRAEAGELATRYFPETTRGLARLGLFTRALDLCREAVRRAPDCEQALFGMAYYMAKCGYHGQRIVPVLQKVLELAPDEPRFRITLGLLELQLARREDAYRTLAKLSLAELAEIHCASCLKKLAALFEQQRDGLRAQTCQSRLTELESG